MHPELETEEQIEPIELNANWAAGFIKRNPSMAQCVDDATHCADINIARDVDDFFLRYGKVNKGRIRKQTVHFQIP